MVRVESGKRDVQELGRKQDAAKLHEAVRCSGQPSGTWTRVGLGQNDWSFNTAYPSARLINLRNIKHGPQLFNLRNGKRWLLS